MLYEVLSFKRFRQLKFRGFEFWLYRMWCTSVALCNHANKVKCHTSKLISVQKLKYPSKFVFCHHWFPNLVDNRVYKRGSWLTGHKKKSSRRFKPKNQDLTLICAVVQILRHNLSEFFFQSDRCDVLYMSWAVFDGIEVNECHFFTSWCAIQLFNKSVSDRIACKFTRAKLRISSSC